MKETDIGGSSMLLTRVGELWEQRVWGCPQRTYNKEKAAKGKKPEPPVEHPLCAAHPVVISHPHSNPLK